MKKLRLLYKKLDAFLGSNTGTAMIAFASRWTEGVMRAIVHHFLEKWEV